MQKLFYLVIEETDNGVLYDHYEKRRLVQSKADEERDKASRSGKRSRK